MELARETAWELVEVERMRETTWELSRTDRLAVPGGWLYRTEIYNEQGDDVVGAVAMVFVAKGEE